MALQQEWCVLEKLMPATEVSSLEIAGLERHALLILLILHEKRVQEVRWELLWLKKQ